MNNPLPPDTVFFILSSSTWDGLSSTSLAIAKELSKEFSVYYFDYPYTYKDLFLRKQDKKTRKRKGAWKDSKRQYHQPFKNFPSLKIVYSPPVWPVNWLSEGTLYQKMMRRNNSVFEQQVQRTCEEENIENYIFLNFFAPFYGYRLQHGKRPPLLSIYQSYDNMEASPYFSKHGVRQEDFCFECYDISLTTSELVRDIIENRTGRHLEVIGNAVDFDLFRKAAEQKPADFPANGKKTIGYTGNIGFRIDFELLYKLAKAYPDCNVVCIGPKKIPKHNSHDFRALDNVYFLGSKPIEELPAYLSFFDCAIIPFVRNDFTAGMYSLKINEYLSQAKPVVTTNYSPSIDQFKQVLYLADSHNDFLKQVAIALNENPSEDEKKLRIKTAKSNSWKDRTTQYLKIIRKALNKNEKTNTAQASEHSNT